MVLTAWHVLLSRSDDLSRPSSGPLASSGMRMLRVSRGSDRHKTKKVKYLEILKKKRRRQEVAFSIAAFFTPLSASEFASELQWPAHPNLGTSDNIFFVGIKT